MEYPEAAKYPGQIVFNAEDDIHYPTLTVAETLAFALKMKTPSERGRTDAMSREEWKDDFLKGLVRTFGIEHTRDTLVGNEFVRGVSGGERKVVFPRFIKSKRKQLLIGSIASLDCRSTSESSCRHALGFSLSRSRCIHSARVHPIYSNYHGHHGMHDVR